MGLYEGDPPRNPIHPWASVGGVPNFGWNPRTRVGGKSRRSGTQMTQEETKNLLKTAQTSKVVNAFTHALAPLL
jgi:hypothetical protein